MANTINLATNFLPKFEKKLTLGELTKDLNKGMFDFSGGHSVKVAIPELAGFAAYNKQAGYNAGTFNLTWQEMTMTQDRYISIGIDEIDNEETKEQAVAGAMSYAAIGATEEMDIYRLCTIANNANISKVASPAALSNGAAVASAIREGEAAITNAKGRLSDCILFINATCYYKLIDAVPYRFTKGQSPDGTFEMFDNMKVVVCPDKFLSNGSEYNATTGVIQAKTYNSTKHQYVNFLIVNVNAVACPVKLYETKLIDASVNQTSRDNKIIPNWYHDCFVLDELASSIYKHDQAEA